MRLRIFGTTAALAVGALGATAAPALAQTAGTVCTPGGSVQYPLSECTLTLSITVVVGGNNVTVRAGGFAGNSPVNLEFRSQPVSIGTARTDAAGTFTANVVVPANATPGVHTIAAVGVNPNGSVRELTGQVTVLAQGASAPNQSAGNLPQTGGGGTVPLTLVGIGLVTAGAAAVRATRARRRATA